MLRMRLTHKGLIIVGLPSLLVLLFIVVLNFLVKQADETTQRLNRSNSLVSLYDALGQDFFRTGQAIYFFQATKDEAVQKRINVLLKRLEADVRRLDIATEYMSGSHAEIEELQKNCREALKLLREAKARIELGGQGTLGLREDLFHVSQSLVDSLRKLTDREKEIIRSNPSASGTNWKRIETLLEIGAAGNIVLALILAFYFNNDAVRRLHIVVQNSHRLVQNKSLLPKVNGTDEIAELDTIFHDMAHTLKAQSKRESAILENAADCIFALNQDFQVIRANPAFMDYFANQQVINAVDFLEFLTEQDRPAIKQHLLRCKMEPSAVRFQTSTLHGKQLEIAAQWSDEENEIYCVGHDITERERLERLRREFVAMITHDIRSPLTSIMLTLETLGIRESLSARGNEDLMAARRSSERLINLTSNLLELEKFDRATVSLNLKPVKLQELLDQSIDTLRALARQRDVLVELEDDELEVLGDGRRIVQVIVNLLANAFAYTPPNGLVRLRAFRLNADWVEVQVCDSGPGMDEEEISRLFTPFTQLGGKRFDSHSSGLGLSICKTIVNAHKGDIGVISTKGAGATFWFRLPATGSAGLPQV